jgi:protein SCO1/2
LGFGLWHRRIFRVQAGVIDAIVLAALFMTSATAHAQMFGGGEPPPLNPSTKKPRILEHVGVDQKIGQQIPPGLTFRDETGRAVRLGDYFGRRPIVLALAYYNCPMLCTQVLNGIAGTLRTLDFQPGRDYEVVVVSIDPREGPRLAAEKKEKYGAAWHLLTGRDEEIHALADAVGFRYEYDRTIDQYAHAAVFEVLTPKGIVSQYFYGIEFAPRDVRFALIQSSGNKLGTIVDRVLLLCYHYDPASGRYGARVINAVRIGGVLLMAAFGTFLFVNLRRDRAEPRRIETGST